ncbi:hypothetical protein SFR_6317 [Streptomyces sp. FR-008]|nr:hypothetical protein SFR_6317 [Streptomyces sp. FR-008]
MQRAVSPAPLEQAEESTAGRYDRIDGITHG